MVAVVYGLFLRFLAHELALRPVIEDVSRDLPDDFELGEAGISLRTRLLLALPLLNIIAGVVVAGLSTTGHRDAGATSASTWRSRWSSPSPSRSS